MGAQRIEALLAAAAAARWDCIAVVPGPNLVYLTGLHFHLSERPTVAFFARGAPPQLVLPELEIEKGRSAPLRFELHPYDDVRGPAGAIAAARAKLGLDRARTGVEGRRMRFLEVELLGGSARLGNADAVFATLRMRKDAGEIVAMRRAALIAEAALRATLPKLEVGETTEKDLASELTLALLAAGSDPELPFSPFAATGANGANPHAVSGDRAVERGHLLTLDWGAAHLGYFSDITRTYHVAGAPLPDSLERAYDAVRAANEAGRRAVRPGAPGQDVDRAARAAIAEAGLGEFFTHRTGHGLGLEGHEEPDMKEGSLVPLEPGMTFTVEPGVYLPGLGGVRIEDDMVVTQNGGECLTTLDRSLVTVG